MANRIMHLKNIPIDAYLAVVELKERKKGRKKENDLAPTLSDCVTEIIREWKVLKEKHG